MTAVCDRSHNHHYDNYTIFIQNIKAITENITFVKEGDEKRMGRRKPQTKYYYKRGLI